MPTGERLMRIKEIPTFEPADNLSREERYLDEVSVPSFRVWRSSTSVVLGRFLDPAAEVRLAEAFELGIPVLRRRSGGGAVFHDPGNVNYSIYLPDAAFPPGGPDALRALSSPVTSLLADLGIEWTWKPPNNVFAAGRKVSGSAEWRHGGKLLHHGTLLVSSDLEMMWRLLRPGGRSAVAPVVNLADLVHGLTAERAEELLAAKLAECRAGSTAPVPRYAAV
jgi:lipoate---protein ligase